MLAKTEDNLVYDNMGSVIDKTKNIATSESMQSLCMKIWPGKCNKSTKKDESLPE